MPWLSDFDYFSSSGREEEETQALYRTTAGVRVLNFVIYCYDANRRKWDIVSFRLIL